MFGLFGFYYYKSAGGYSNLILNTDWNISTDSNTGYPAITCTDSTNNLTSILNNLMLEDTEGYIQLLEIQIIL